MKYKEIRPLTRIENRGIIRIDLHWDGKPPLPGQFFMLTTERMDIFLPRPFSTFDFQHGVLSLLIKAKGRFTHLIMETDKFYLMGPLGNPAPLVTKGIFVGGGIGIAPLHYHARLTETYIFIAGSPTDNFRYFLTGMEENVVYTTEDGSYGVKGFATDPLERILQEHPGTPVFACGPIPMLKRVKEITGGENTYLYMEQVMACGIGGCKGCAIRTKDGYKMVCSDGPVFNGMEVLLE